MHTKAIAINPRLAEAYYNRGLAYYGRGIAYQYKGEHDLALLDYDKAIEISPRYGEAYNNREA